MIKEFLFLLVGATFFVASAIIYFRYNVMKKSLKLSSPKKAARLFYKKLRIPFLGKFQVVLVRKLELIDAIGCGSVPNYLIALFAGDKEEADKLVADRTDEEKVEDLKQFQELKINMAKKCLVKPSYDDYLKARLSLDKNFEGTPIDDSALDALLFFQLESIAPLLKKKTL